MNPSSSTTTMLCGRSVVRVLNESTFVCKGVRHLVIFKRLSEDCLLSGQLHPSIRERLTRVRELAHPQVASLLGVEKEGEDVYLIWEYIHGQRWDAEARNDKLRRDLRASIKMLHDRGIVHGSLHSGNVFVRNGQVALTDISPLLYSDPADDLSAFARLLGDKVQSHETARWRIWSVKTRSLLGALGVAVCGIAIGATVLSWWHRQQSANQPVPIAREVQR